MNHVFKMTNSIEHVVALDVDDAWRVWHEHTGEERTEHPAVSFERISDWRQLTLHGDAVPDGKQTKTCGVWAREFGRGHLGGNL